MAAMTTIADKDDHRSNLLAIDFGIRRDMAFYDLRFFWWHGRQRGHLHADDLPRPRIEPVGKTTAADLRTVSYSSQART